jgi:hypothetical protein
MTEVGWMSCPLVAPMLALVRDTATERQLRLFACGCVRQLWAFVPPNPSSERVLIEAEKLAEERDGPVRKVRQRRTTVRTPEATTALGDAFEAASQAATQSVLVVRRGPNHRERERQGYELQYAQAELLRDIVGNPFRSISVDPAWRTSTVRALAAGIYADHAFDRLPILADALMDAGCEHALILRHCRTAGVHGRGCWLIDALIGR